MRAQEDRPPAPVRRLVGVRLLAVLAAASLALHLPGLTVHLFNSDEASLATMAMVIDRGGRLYRDTADRKPPVVPYVYAAVAEVTGSRDLRPVRAIAALVLAATAALLAAEAQRRYRSRRAAYGAATLFLLASVAFFPADTQAAGFEVFMLLPMTAAVVAAGRGRAAQAGLWLAIACLCKQTAVTTALPIAWLLYRSGGWQLLARALGAGSAVIAVTAIAFGPSDFLLWTVTGNGGYLALRGSVGATIVRGLGMTGAFLGINLALFVLAGESARRRAVGVDLWLWLAGGAVGVLAGLRFFGHYYLQLLPPLVLLAAAALPSVGTLARRAATGAMAVSAAVMCAVAFLPPNERGLLPYGAIVAEVRRITHPHDTVLVWGEFPEIYWAADREPATRFIHTGFLTGNSGGRDPGTGDPGDGLPGGWAMLDHDLRAHPADLIVDTSPAGIRNSEYYPLERTALWERIRHQYQLAGTLDGVRFYRYVGPAGP
ncbi:MAG TPA: glycosyltransferase family 39 protein [Acidimicrobiales bacterium]|nr:glycosyltransferase family 39 protein [Acidimicrobiales bacterium]